jgi:hypothetical protein
VFDLHTSTWVRISMQVTIVFLSFALYMSNSLPHFSATRGGAEEAGGQRWVESVCGRLSASWAKATRTTWIDKGDEVQYLGRHVSSLLSSPTSSLSAT